MSNLPVALTIAGSDSSGGAGLQADLKTFEAHGVFGASAVTLVTAQNTRGVTAIEFLSPALVRSQCDAVFDDLAVRAVKLGALGRADIVERVAEVLRDRTRATSALPVVVDPVMVSKHGHPLLDPVAQEALAAQILPLATVLTPNVHEAAALTGRTLDNVQAITDAARALLDRGPSSVVVTGGGLDGDEVFDVVATAAGVRVLTTARVHGTNVHGSGCTFAAAIAARLALGASVEDAIDGARAFTVAAIAAAPGIGAGVGPLGHRAAARVLSL